jgi:hypothetical protein
MKETFRWEPSYLDGTDMTVMGVPQIAPAMLMLATIGVI